MEVVALGILLTVVAVLAFRQFRRYRQRRIIEKRIRNTEELIDTIRHFAREEFLENYKAHLGEGKEYAYEQACKRFQTLYDSRSMGFLERVRPQREDFVSRMESIALDWIAEEEGGNVSYLSPFEKRRPRDTDSHGKVNRGGRDGPNAG